MCLDIVNVNIILVIILKTELDPFLIALMALFRELADVAVDLGGEEESYKGISLVDLCALWKLAVSLQVTGLVGGVLEDDVSLLILVISQGKKNDISLVDPDLIAIIKVNIYILWSLSV